MVAECVGRLLRLALEGLPVARPRVLCSDDGQVEPTDRALGLDTEQPAAASRKADQASAGKGQVRVPGLDRAYDRILVSIVAETERLT